jgi:hypothetical protein
MTDVDEHVADGAAFFDLDNVAGHHSETQHVHVEIPGLVQIVGGEANVRETFIRHLRPPMAAYLRQILGTKNAQSINCIYQILLVVDYSGNQAAKPDEFP